MADEDEIGDFYEDLDEDFDFEDLAAICPYCGEFEDHAPGCVMADYPFDLEVDPDEEG